MSQGFDPSGYPDKPPASYQIKPTTVWVVPSSTSDTRLLGALLIYRMAQGAFGAPLMPLAQAIILDTYPKHQHALANSIFDMSVIVGPAIAPSIGGYLTEVYDWRWTPSS